MRKNTRKTTRIAMGLDLGDRLSHVAAVTCEDEVRGEWSVKTTQAEMQEFFSDVPKETRVVLEAGTHSPWVSAHAARVIPQPGQSTPKMFFQRQIAGRSEISGQAHHAATAITGTEMA